MSKPTLYLVGGKATQLAAQASFEQMELFSSKKEVHLISIDQFNSSSFNYLLQKLKPGLILDTREYPNFFSIYENMKMAKEDFNKNSISYNVLPIHKNIHMQEVWGFVNGFKSLIDIFFASNTSSKVVILFATKHMQDFFRRHYMDLISQSMPSLSIQDENNVTL